MSENVEVLITGSGNNTLNNKNILPVNGKPLLSYGALAAKGVKVYHGWRLIEQFLSILTKT